MPWFKVDDGLSTKIETTRIPRAHRAAAMGLWALAGSWSARELTDGLIPAHMVDELAGTPEDAQRLVDAGFWSVVPDGFQFVTWDGEQPMRAKVVAAREKNAAKVQNWRARNRVTPPVTDSGTNADVTPPPTRPDPTSSDEEKNSPSATTRELESAFDEAYSAWPKKTERKKSFAAFSKASKSRDLTTLTADVIRFGRAYAATTDRQFVPALCVWINGERWTDDLPAPRAPSDAEWNSFLSEPNPQDPLDCSHRWLPDGTCNFCTARQTLQIQGAA